MTLTAGLTVRNTEHRRCVQKFVQKIIPMRFINCQLIPSNSIVSPWNITVDIALQCLGLGQNWGTPFHQSLGLNFWPMKQSLKLSRWEKHTDWNYHPTLHFIKTSWLLLDVLPVKVKYHSLHNITVLHSITYSIDLKYTIHLYNIYQHLLDSWLIIMNDGSIISWFVSSINYKLMN